MTFLANFFSDEGICREIKMPLGPLKKITVIGMYYVTKLCIHEQGGFYHDDAINQALNEFSLSFKLSVDAKVFVSYKSDGCSDDVYDQCVERQRAMNLRCRHPQSR